MKRIIVFLIATLLVGSIGYSQKALSTKAIGGPGTHLIDRTLFHNNATYLLGNFGTNYTKYVNFTIDGHTFEQCPNVKWTNYILKLNNDNSFAWFKHQTFAEKDEGTIDIYNAELDSEGNVFVLFRVDEGGKVVFGGDEFESNGYPFILAKYSTNGELIWHRKLNRFPVFTVSSSGNPVLVIAINSGFDFRFSDWDNDFHWNGADGISGKTFRMAVLSGADGSMITDKVLTNDLYQSLNQDEINLIESNSIDIDDISLTKIGEHSVLTLSRIGEHNLFYNETQLDKRFVTYGPKTVGLVKSEFDNTYIRLTNFNEDDTKSHISKYNNSLTEVIAQGEVNQAAFFGRSIVDNDGNIIIMSHQFNSSTQYNGVSLYMDDSPTNSARFTYLNCDLELMGQKHLYYPWYSNAAFVSFGYNSEKNTIKTLGNESQSINIDTLLYFPSDYNNDIVIFDFDNTGILIKSLTLRNHTTFSLNTGESKDLAVDFFNPQQLNIVWLLNGNTVSSEPNYTFNATAKGEFNLTLKAYDPNYPSKIFSKHWLVNVTSPETELLFPQGHALYNNDIGRFAIDSIGNYFWGIDKYKKAVYQVNLSNVADYTEWINPAETDLNNENPMEVRLDANRNPWFLMSSGLVLEKSSGQWAKHSLTDMGFTASPTQLCLIDGVMHISTENGVVKTGEVWEDVPNVEVYTTYLPTYSNPGQPNTTPTRKVFAMHQTTNGNTWIGTEYGLKNLSNGDTLYPQNHGMPFNRVLSIASSGNYLYFGDSQNGLVEYNVEQNSFSLFILFDVNRESYSDMGIRSMSTDSNGNVWFVNDAGGYGNGKGLFCFNPSSIRITHYNQNVTVLKTIEFGQKNTVYARIDGRIRVLNKEYVETQGVITFSVTSNSQPIENAVVTINQEELTTNSSGLASVTLPFASYSYTVTHPNYQTYNANISFQEETTVDIVLQSNNTSSGLNLVKGISVYPNPFQEAIYIDNYQFANSIAISTIAGICVLSKPLNSNIVNTSRLNKGVYIITVGLKDGEKQVFRLVKQ